MLFTSIVYFLFLAASLLVYYVLPARYRNYFLIAASAFFYMYVKLSYIFIILFVIAINYLTGIQIEKTFSKTKKLRYLYASLFVNIAILVFFKYWNFLIEAMLDLLGVLHVNTNIPIIEIALPLGLSYYIFQVIGYTIDVYRGTQKAERNIFDFSLFALFFPKLLVGPIERAKGFLPQLKTHIDFDKDNLIEGGRRIAWGLVLED